MTDPDAGALTALGMDLMRQQLMTARAEELAALTMAARNFGEMAEKATDVEEKRTLYMDEGRCARAAATVLASITG